MIALLILAFFCAFAAWQRFGPDRPPKTVLLVDLPSDHETKRTESLVEGANGIHAFWRAFGHEWSASNPEFARAVGDRLRLGDPKPAVEFPSLPHNIRWLEDQLPPIPDRQVIVSIDSYQILDGVHGWMTTTPWTPAQFDGGGEWLIDFERRLVWIESAADADGLCLPTARAIGVRTRDYVDVSYTMSILAAAKDLQRSAMRALAEGNCDQSWAQIKRAERLMRHLFEDRPCLLTYLIVMARHDLFENAVGRLLASPDLDDALLDQIAKHVARGSPDDPPNEADSDKTGRGECLAKAWRGERDFLIDNLRCLPWVADRLAWSGRLDVPPEWLEEFPHPSRLSIDWQTVFGQLHEDYEEIANAATRLDAAAFDTWIAAKAEQYRAWAKWSALDRVAGWMSRRFRSQMIARQSAESLWQSDGVTRASEYRVLAERNAARLELAVEIVRRRRNNAKPWSQLFADAIRDDNRLATRVQLHPIRDGFQLVSDDDTMMEVASAELSLAEKARQLGEQFLRENDL